MFFTVILVLASFLEIAIAVNPYDLQGLDIEDIIKEYFLANLPYTDMLYFLTTFHNFDISLRHLHRLLRKLGLCRRKQRTLLNEVIEFIRTKISTSSSSFGYRVMLCKLRENRFVIDSQAVCFIMKALDPEGVANRSAKRLNRRTSRSPWPNHIWHIDGYDKLKPFGMAIHGCIDGYSRRIM